MIGRQRQIGTVRQLHDLDPHLFHFRPARASAIRDTCCNASSVFVCGGQSSTLFAVTRWIVLLSPPMIPVAGDTSLARLQSHALRASFCLACCTTFSGSAA